MMTADLLDRCRRPFQQVVMDAGVELSDIHHVVLVGGATRMPAVVELVKDLVKHLTGGKGPSKGANPDEVVVVGACLQAGVLKGEVKNLLLDDAIPWPLGIETWTPKTDELPLAITGEGGFPEGRQRGIFTKMIERNTSIPAKRGEIFTTAVDNQSSVLVQVFEGEREIAAYNKKLGMCELAGIPPAPHGTPQIEVALDIDANGTVGVSVKDLGTGRQQSVIISGGSALSQNDIDRMIADAEKYAEKDRNHREEAEVRNRSEALAYNVERFLSENADKLPDDLKSEFSSSLAALKKALQGTDIEAIRTAAEADLGRPEKPGVQSRIIRLGHHAR